MGSSSPAQLPGLTIEAVEWLPSGADSGLVRVRGRWSTGEAARPGLPLLVLRGGGEEHRFESLPDARFARDPASWRGSYLVPATLVAAEPDALWVEWPGGVRAGLPPLAPGLATPPVPTEPAEQEPAGGQLIDRGVLAERRARRAEAAEQAQARIAAEALRAVEALELQSAELERRLAEATAEPSADPQGAERHQEALAGALGSLARLRAHSQEWRLQLRTSEIAHAGEAVRIAVLEADRRTATAAVHAVRERHARELGDERARSEQYAVALAAAAEAATQARAELAAARTEAERTRTELEAAREEAAARDSAEARTAELRGRVADLEAVVTVTETRLHAAEAAATITEARLRVESVARAVLEDELDRERAALTADHQARTSERDALAADLAARTGDLEALAAERADFAADLAARTGEVEALAAERDALAADLAARTGDLEALAAERAGLGVEVEARAGELAARTGDLEAMVAELDARSRDLDALAAERDALARDLRTERDAAAILAAELRDVLRAETREGVAGRLEAELADARSSIAAMDRQLEAERAARAEAEAAMAASRSEGGALQDRIAELDRRAAGLADEARLEQAARTQTDAAAAASPPPAEQSGRLVADLDAAAAALRETAPVEGPDIQAGDPAAARDEIATGDPTTTGGQTATDDPTTGGETVPAEAVVPAAAVPRERTGPTIVSAAGHPPRDAAVGTSARYPALRGAVVKLAHDDPVAAGRLLVALLPAQAAALANAIDYDLTVKEVGTFAVTVAGGSTTVAALERRRPRGQADFHLTADALTLAELLAGVDRRVGRFLGPARYSGSRRRLRVLRALPATRLTLAEAARAGAALEPGLVYPALAYAVHPSWTRGEAFTIAQEIVGDPRHTWYLTARDGGGLAVTNQPPSETADATVSMTREAFDLLLAGRPIPSGVRPSVRGDQDAVARMKAWTDRAQCLDGS